MPAVNIATVRRAKFESTFGGSSESTLKPPIRPVSSISIAIVIEPTLPSAALLQSGSESHAGGIACVNARPRSRTPAFPTAPNEPPPPDSDAPAPAADAPVPADEGADGGGDADVAGAGGDADAAGALELDDDAAGFASSSSYGSTLVFAFFGARSLDAPFSTFGRSTNAGAFSSTTFAGAGAGAGAGDGAAFGAGSFGPEGSTSAALEPARLTSYSFSPPGTSDVVPAHSIDVGAAAGSSELCGPACP